MGSEVGIDHEDFLAPCDIELGENIVGMRLGRTQRDEQGVADLLIGHVLQHHGEDLGLTIGQLILLTEDGEDRIQIRGIILSFIELFLRTRCFRKSIGRKRG